MATEGHTATVGVARVISYIGEGKCPRCGDELGSIDASPELEEVAEGVLRCTECGSEFDIGGAGR